MAAPRGGGGQDGWNDPPMFNYNAQTQTGGTPSPQRTLLNKRVSFPLAGAAGSTPPVPIPVLPIQTDAEGVLLSPKAGPPQLPPVQILPPTSTTSVHPPVPLLVPSMSPPIDPSCLPPSFATAERVPMRSETLPELLERLQLDSGDALRKYTKRVLHETLDVLQENIQGRSREDVQARLCLLDDQWRDEKLSEGARIKLGCLASAVKNNDLKQADSLHLALMVDHISEVSQWMVGVKRIINELKLSGAVHPSVSTKAAPPLVATSTEAPPSDPCIDTENLPKLQPMITPEMLVPATSTEENGSESDQVKKEESDAVKESSVDAVGSEDKGDTKNDDDSR